MSNITDKIKSFEDACQALGLDPTALPDVSKLREKDQAAQIAQYKLSIIAEALNEGWTPDWKNNREYKYYPWFDMEDDNGSGLGLSCLDCDCDDSISSVGSRLSFKSSDLARYAGKQFTGLYADLFLIKA